ncbi:unnamed protein product [Caenorhabditis angaria]|uniref:CX domain-containing protein n=1 Tax=Caenorhabditis angaria TaxID=860376 RepID=A0A9P1IWA9_9PELO|nr:unnamed protein product [Caenorhabditis angaria]
MNLIFLLLIDFESVTGFDVSNPYIEEDIENRKFHESVFSTELWGRFGDEFTGKVILLKMMEKDLFNKSGFVKNPEESFESQGNQFYLGKENHQFERRTKQCFMTIDHLANIRNSNLTHKKEEIINFTYFLQSAKLPSRNNLTEITWACPLLHPDCCGITCCGTDNRYANNTTDQLVMLGHFLLASCCLFIIVSVTVACFCFCSMFFTKVIRVNFLDGEQPENENHVRDLELVELELKPLRRSKRFHRLTV